MTGCRGGCSGGSAPAPAASTLALFPPETRIVVSADFQRIRATPLWQTLSTLATQEPADRNLIADLTARTGLDPFHDLHRVVAAFPEEARADGSFVLLMEGAHLDQKRLVTYAQEQAKHQGGTLTARSYAGRTLWSESPRGPAGFFLDDSRFVLGGGGWADKVATLSATKAPSAAGNEILAHLVTEVAVGHAIWLAAQVPDATRARLMADPRFGVQASVMRFAAGIELGPGLEAELVADLSNAADARALVDKVDTFVKAARQSPQALLLGAGPYLDGIHTKSDGPRALVRLSLGQAQTLELANRLAGLAQLRRRGP